MTDGPWLVVGLGNPGPQYAGNRHNVGQMVLDELARRTGVTFGSKGGLLSRRPQAAVAEARLGVLPGGVPGPRVVLAKPTTYMNVSGGPVAALATYYDIPVERTVVVHDELDIPFADVRLKRGGGDNGHNGLKSIRRSTGSGEFYRVRVGIGRPPGRQDPADFVLKPWGSAERKELPMLVSDAADAVELLVHEGLERAQNRYNT